MLETVKNRDPAPLPNDLGATGPNAVTLFEVGEWVVDTQAGRIRRGLEVRPVQPRVLDVLRYLAERSGETVSRQELLSAVWGDVNVVDDVVWRCVSQLRRVLGDDRQHPRYVETIPRRGYRLVARVRRSSNASAPSASRRVSGSLARGATWRHRRPLRAVGLAAATVLAGLVAGSLGPGERGESAPSETIEPRSANDFYDLGRTYYRRGQPGDLERAAVQFRRALELRPALPIAWAGLADTYVAQAGWGGRPDLVDAARQSAEKAVALAPDLPEAHRSLGLALLLSGQLESSLQASLKANQMRPDWAPPMHNAAIAHAAVGRLSEAVRWQRRAVEAVPLPQSLGMLGSLWARLDAPVQALEATRRARNIEPFEHQSVATESALLLHRGRVAAAWRMLAPALAVAPDSPVLLKQAALVRLRGGHDDAARGLLERALRGAPPSGRGFLLLLLAALDRSQGLTEEAAIKLERVRAGAEVALLLGDERWGPRFELAVVSAANHEPHQARAWLRRAIDRGFLDYALLLPGSPMAVLGIGVEAEAVVGELSARIASMRARALVDGRSRVGGAARRGSTAG